MAIHDASITSLVDFGKMLANMREQLAVATPIQFLLDRAPAGDSGRGVVLRAGEMGSDRTINRYEVSDNELMVLIDKRGTLVFANRRSRTYRTNPQGKLLVEVDWNMFAGDPVATARASRLESIRAALKAELGLRKSAILE